jgi:hypothetical protein
MLIRRSIATKDLSLHPLKDLYPERPTEVRDLSRRRPAFVPFLRTSLTSTLFTLSLEGLSKACATRINVLTRILSIQQFLTATGSTENPAPGAAPFGLKAAGFGTGAQGSQRLGIFWSAASTKGRNREDWGLGNINGWAFHPAHGPPCWPITRRSPLSGRPRCQNGHSNYFRNHVPQALPPTDRMSSCARGFATSCKPERTSPAIAAARRLLPF